MRAWKRLIAAAVLAIIVGGAFIVGQITGPRSAEASSTRAYTLRIGDKVTVLGACAGKPEDQHGHRDPYQIDFGSAGKS